MGSSSSTSGSANAVAECVYVYDSLGRALEEAQSLDTEGSVVTRYATNHAYFSAVIAGVTYPNGRQIQNTYDALYGRTQVADTSGGAPGSSSSSSSSDSSGAEGEAFIAQWDFFGDRIAETRLGNGITCTFMNNTRTHSAVQSPGSALPAWGDASSDRLGYDGSGRMIAKRYIPSTLNESGGYEDTTPVVGFTTRFDKASNKFFERALHAENRSFLYIPLDEDGQPSAAHPGVDSMNRLLQYQRGNLAIGGGSVTTPLTLPGADASRTYDLDHLGNWKKSIYEPIPELPESSSSISSTSSMSSEDTPLPPAYDLRNHNPLNQITRRKTSADGAWDTFAYDLNGNLLDDGERLMAYDSLNRLVQVARKSDGAVIGRYLYDAVNRRVQKVVSNGGLSGDIPNGTSQYTYFAGTWQDTEEFFASEESEESPQPFKHFIWGTYIDELTQLTLLQTAGSQELPLGAYFPLQDLLFRTACVTEVEQAESSSNSEATASQIVEAYDYDVYGNTLILIPTKGEVYIWNDNIAQSEYSANTTMFCGYCSDADVGLYLARHRSYSPKIGRWCHRDPIDYDNGMNIYQYTQSSPDNRRDTWGLSDEIEDCLCGPDITDGLMGLILEINQQLHKLKTEANPPGLLWFMEAGMSFDWGNIRSENCPSGPKCRNTYTLCGTCVHDHWIGNFIYAYSLRFLGYSESLIKKAGQAVQDGAPGDPESGKYTRYVDPPWDVAGYDLAIKMIDSKAWPIKSSSMCEMLKGNADLWDKANNTSVTYKSNPRFHGGYVDRYPTPHISGYESCRPCAEKNSDRLRSIDFQSKNL